ncbi:MAG TPA: CbtA family protein [Actinomycetota bacterium]|nr:CbtA family protein [Actinomycetota bacterium]
MGSHGPSLGRAVRPARNSRTAASERRLSAGGYLARGLVSGLAAGLLSGLFLLLVGEPSIDEAIRLEHAASSGQHAAEVFTRGEQRIGMVLAAGLYGLAIGGVLGIVLLAASRRMAGTAWDRSMKVALAGFASSFLIPFLKYPANPPGVGDPETVGLRTAGFLFLVLVSVAAWVGAAAGARRLAAQGVERHRRHVIVGACYLLVMGTAYLALPPAVSPGDVPAGLLWDFRMASVGGQAVLWTAAGAILGYLTLKVEKRASTTGAPQAAEQEV